MTSRIAAIPATDAPAARPAPNFDPVARAYRWMELFTFGPALARCRNRYLPQLTDRSQALILGDGDGRFTSALLAANSHLRADAVDSSAAMLAQLTRRAHAATPDAATRLRTHHSDAIAFTHALTTAACYDLAYDLVVTHFFLDCFTEPQLQALCARIEPHLQPHVLWLVSDFRIPTGAMRLPARALVRSLYLAFRLLTGLRVARLPDHAAALTAAGFTRIAQHHSLAGLLAAELWEYAPAADSA